MNITSARSRWKSWLGATALPRWRDVSAEPSARAGKHRRGNHAIAADPGRTRDVAHLLIDVRAWAEDHPDIRAVAVAGSWARAEARMDSDVDLVVLTAEPERYGADLAWAAELGELLHVRTESWGALTEVRFVLIDGLEIEFGFAPLSWATVDPIDEGTRRVIVDGMTILHDPDRLLARLQRAATRSA